MHPSGFDNNPDGNGRSFGGRVVGSEAEQAAQSNKQLLPRQRLLEEALKITTRDRNQAYGNPEDNFQNIADNWNLYLKQAKTGKLISSMLTSQDVAHMMVLMKMARLATNPGHKDSLLDIAGYAACAADCQERLAIDYLKKEAKVPVSRT